MLDVEYLRTRPAFDGTMVYRYQTGVLRPAVLEALRKIAVHENRLLVTGDPDDPSGSGAGSLFKGLPVYDYWNFRKSRRLLENLLTRIAAGPDERAAYFVPAHRVRSHPLWPDIAASCFVIDEPMVTHETLNPVLRYLEAATDLAECPDLLTQPGFVERIEMCLGRNGAELPEVIHAFDEVVLTCTDPSTNRFDAQRHKTEVVQGRSSPLRLVRNFVITCAPWALVALVMCFDQRHWQRGWSVHDVVRELYRITEELLSGDHPAQSHRVERSGRRPPRVALERGGIDLRIILWTAVLFAWDDRLTRGSQEVTHGYRRGPDLLMVTIDHLGRDFLARAGRLTIQDPLAGIWRDLRLGAMKAVGGRGDVLAVPRAKVLRCLAQRLTEQVDRRALWLDQLRGFIMSAVEEVDRASAEPDGNNDEMNQVATAPPLASALPIPPAPVTFEAVIGRANAVTGLRTRVQKAAHQTPVILHGPEGVGKRTLARIYSQAMLCMTPAQSGSPCHQCGECIAFNEKASLGYIELDVSNGVDVRMTREVIGKASRPRLAERCAVVIANADACAPAAFDVLLKTLEEMPPRTSFVLLAQNLKNVRLAGQSRSEIYRVRPLSPAESHACLTMFGDRGYDQRVLDLLVAIGQGLPGRLRQVWARSLAAGEPTLKPVQAVLGQDWAEEMIAFWSALLGGEEQSASVLEWSRVGADEQIQRIKIFLTEFYLRGMHRSPMKMAGAEPALLHVDESAFSDLAVCLQKQAEFRGMNSEELWRVLAQHWLSDSFVDPLSSLPGGRRVQRRLVQQDLISLPRM